MSDRLAQLEKDVANTEHVLSLLGAEVRSLVSRVKCLQDSLAQRKSLMSGHRSALIRMRKEVDRLKGNAP